MTRFILPIVIAIPVLLGVAGYCISLWMNAHAAHIEAPERIELGLLEQGQIADAEVSISNTGPGLLRLSNFFTSCTCMAVSRSSEGAAEKLTQASVAPGEVLRFTVRVRVPGNLSGSFDNVVQFDTNDPTRRQVRVRIVAEVSGQIVSVPNHVSLGRVSRGQLIAQTISIRNTGRKTVCKLAKADSTAPAIALVSAIRHKSEPADPNNAHLGMVIGEIDIKVCAPQESGPFNANVLVFEDGATEPVLTIGVDGVIIPRYLLAPSAISMPRVVEGKSVYSAKCIFRSTTSEFYSLTHDTPPEGFVVEIRDASANQEGTKLISIDWRPEKTERIHPSRSWSLALKATALDGTSEIIQLPVVCNVPD